MKKLAILALAIALGGCSLFRWEAAPPAAFESVATEAAVTVTIQTSAEQTLSEVRKTLEIWAETPTAASACGTATGCCDITTGAVNAQCKALAQAVNAGSEGWARAVFNCLQGSGNWQCNVDFLNGEKLMYCETFPNLTDPRGAARLGDVAICASRLAAALF